MEFIEQQRRRHNTTQSSHIRFVPFRSGGFELGAANHLAWALRYGNQSGWDSVLHSNPAGGNCAIRRHSLFQHKHIYLYIHMVVVVGVAMRQFVSRWNLGESSFRPSQRERECYGHFEWCEELLNVQEWCVGGCVYVFVQFYVDDDEQKRLRNTSRLKGHTIDVL